MCLLATLAAACSVSKIDRGAPVRVEGVLLDARGRPAGGTSVVLLKEPDLGEALVGVVVTVGTLGAVCFTDQPPSVCARAPKATTGADGSFSFQLRGRDTQGSLGNASSFHLSAAMPPHSVGAPGPLVTARFQIQATTVQVPPLRFWNPPLALAQAQGAIRASWPDLDPSYGRAGTHRLTFFAGSRGGVVWSSEGSSPAEVDARLLEDTRGTAAVEAITTATGPDTRFVVTYRSAQVDYSSPAGPPPSRGATCFAEVGGGRLVASNPCPLTDGDLTSLVPLPGDGGEAASGARIDLGRVVPTTLVTVRGCASECVVETSADGQQWASAGRGQGGGFTVVPPPRTTARYVRIRSATGTALPPRLSEVSVWSAPLGQLG